MNRDAKDISSREDIELLMNAFYERLLADDRINYIFTDVANINIKAHIPVIVNFWESVLLNENVYHNNTMKIHMDLNDKTEITKEHFTVWLNHFNTTVDEMFEGQIAMLAKQRARSVATLMEIKIAQNKKPRN